MTAVADRYELRERLGGGATADVYRAHDRSLGRDVALKLMRPAMADDRELLDRFEREVTTLATVAHENVVGVVEHGTFDGAPYLAMELVDGPTLQQLLRDHGPLAEDRIRRVGAQIAAALDATHARGIVHRDLKPANVLVSSEGIVKVSDFGVAHLEAMTQLTRTGEILGTPRYLAPEQVCGRVDARTDVYALGIILYELATGRPPFDAETPAGIVRAQLEARPVPPRRLRPRLSPSLERVILRALEKEPAKRFQTAAEIVGALREPVAAPVVAMARRAPGHALRSFGVAALVLSVVAMLASVALASAADVRTLLAASVPTAVPTASQRPATPAPTSTPRSALPTIAPPSPTPQLTTPTPAPTRPLPAPAAADANASPGPSLADPRATVALFYQLVGAHRYDDAAALWTARMRAAYPPSTNLYGRFDRTSAITLRASTLTFENGTSASVAVDVVETLVDGTVRRWVGQWYLVRSGTTWLMDAPALGPA